MQDVSPRQQQIISTLPARRAVSTVDDLAVRFDVTPQTIRKDLNDLCDGSCWRAPMAARCCRRASRTSPMRRGASLRPSEKALIGRQRRRLIPNNCSLFINIGTTTEEVARALRPPRGAAGHHQQHSCRNNPACRCRRSR